MPREKDNGPRRGWGGCKHKKRKGKKPSKTRVSMGLAEKKRLLKEGRKDYAGGSEVARSDSETGGTQYPSKGDEGERRGQKNTRKEGSAKLLKKREKRKGYWAHPKLDVSVVRKATNSVIRGSLHIRTANKPER